ncbi:MAG: hypothetical protein IJH91_03075 [Mogibacterium sp.]|nr:hypothetical protein [Mogibacterium sp.]
MNAATIIAVIALACIIFFAARYIIKSKQRGAKCIGCPFSDSGQCPYHAAAQKKSCCH